jgi:2-amino-4-hydroxy-6-hydroxymethyldihydropteridine diphosphokinase
MNKVYLLIGGNMGDRLLYLSKAREAIEKECGKITKQSSIYETEAWGVENQEPFLNQALGVETHLSAINLLTAILKIEKNLGRKRDIKYGPRLIDIDISFFNDDIIDVDNLKIPHPQMQHRRFALQCLNDIAAQKMHPAFHKTIAQLLTECTDPLTVHKFS